MRVRELLPFIDENQEIVIRECEGPKTIAGTASEIRHNQNKKEIEDFLDRDIECVFNHAYKMYIMVEYKRRWKFKCELMK